MKKIVYILIKKNKCVSFIVHYKGLTVCVENGVVNLR